VIIVAFLVAIAVIGALLYLLVIHREVPGAIEQRFGVLEALPVDVGKWCIDTESTEGKAAMQQGLRREVRYWHDPAKDRLVKQARYKNPATSAIVRVEPEEVIRRKRVRA
jgi:hypothetical protein